MTTCTSVPPKRIQAHLPHPLRTIYSYRKSIKDDRYLAQGCFVKEQYDIWTHVKENLDSNPVVIDADDLLTKPKETLFACCFAVGLPYSDSLLQWPWDASTYVIKKTKTSGDNIDMVAYKEAIGSSEAAVT